MTLRSLHTVHALDHLEVQTARCAPANRRGHQKHVPPVDQRFVDSIELVIGIHLGDRTRPGAGAGSLGIKALAVTEGQLTQTNQSRLVTQLVGVLHCGIEQRIRGRKAWMIRLHRGRGNSDHPNTTRFSIHGPRQRMRLVRFFGTLFVRLAVHLDPTLAHADVIGRDDIFLEAPLALPFDAMELPLMPRADYIVAIESAFAERSPGVIARTTDRAKDTIAKAQRHTGAPNHDLLHRSLA